MRETSVRPLVLPRDFRDVISGFFAPYKLTFSIFLLTLTDNSIEILLFKKLYVVAEHERRLQSKETNVI